MVNKTVETFYHEANVFWEYRQKWGKIEVYILEMSIRNHLCHLNIDRSILTYPWVELGGKVNITCAKTGYNASVTFHTKPFYGGKLHRVTGEVKNVTSGRVICKVHGEWNGDIEFIYTSNQVCTSFFNICSQVRGLSTF